MRESLSTAVAGATLAAVSDPDLARMADVAERFGARTVPDPLALIGDADVDAVIIAAPDASHKSFTLACLDAGKPVLCEKPLAPTTPECLEVIDREVALGRRLVTVGYMRRFDPGYVAMKRRLDSGELGAALMFHCIHRNKTAAYAAMASAHIANSAVHEIDIARFVLGHEVRRATALLPRKTSLAPMQDPQILLLEMDDGAIVDVEIFLNAQYGYDVRAELVCERGTVSLSPPHDTILREDRSESFGFPDDWRPRFVRAYEAELQAWIAAIATGTTVGASAWDGYVATAVAEAGVASLTSGGTPTDVKLVSRPALYR